MISTSFKKQLIINYYNTQLLPLSDKIQKNYTDTIKRRKKLLLFKIDDGRLIEYKYKDININYNIRRLLNDLTDTIYSIYKYSENKTFNIQEDISIDIKDILVRIYNINNSWLDYTEYLEDIYD